MKKNQPRTYYFSCETVTQANEWVNALNNNIEMIREGALAGGTAPNAAVGAIPGMGGLNLTQLHNAVGMAQAMQQDQKNAQDPDKSLGWYRRATQSSLSDEALYAKVIAFHDQLKAAGVQ